MYSLQVYSSTGFRRSRTSQSGPPNFKHPPGTVHSYHNTADPCCTSHPWDCFIATSVHVSIPSPFHQCPSSAPLRQRSVCSPCLCVCFCFVWSFGYQMPRASEITWSLSFSDLFHLAQYPLGHRWQTQGPRHLVSTWRSAELLAPIRSSYMYTVLKLHSAL